MYENQNISIQTLEFLSKTQTITCIIFYRYIITILMCFNSLGTITGNLISFV